MRGQEYSNGYRRVIMQATRSITSALCHSGLGRIWLLADELLQLPGAVPEHPASYLLAFDPPLAGDSPWVFYRAIASNPHRSYRGQSPG